MRSTNVPPSCFATAQLKSVERALPTWNMPVGDGAKRTRMGELPGAGNVTGTSLSGGTDTVPRSPVPQVADQEPAGVTGTRRDDPE
ncbi:hypothetical protein GCM10017772_10880 [Promicromonospora soli]|uniref:Uncharacterized protein n=1 Tax=Promicromonospora soli TaxID=2035533 RepID=A0A919FLF7_9MICO|nr:hypothetical protein GCM10017772_10880 [Promicromonospora soli]